MFEIKGTVSKGDYLYAKVPGHPFATKNGYVLYHRVLMENKIARILNKYEIVHHKNGNKKDNRIENLEILSRSDHAKLHGLKGRKFVRLKCPSCGNIFVREKRNSFFCKGSKFTACSNKCRGVFSTKSDTKDIERGLKENFIEEFVGVS